MKKVLAVFAALMLISAAAVAEVDLSGMSFQELVALAHKVDQAIWASDGWQEVTVPPGTWKIGEDIPAARWTVKPEDGSRIDFYYCQSIDAAGSPVTDWQSAYKYENLYSPSYKSYDENPAREITVDCAEGMFIVIKNGNAVFSPYTGKPSFGFK